MVVNVLTMDSQKERFMCVCVYVCVYLLHTTGVRRYSTSFINNITCHNFYFRFNIVSWFSENIFIHFSLTFVSLAYGCISNSGMNVG